MENVIKLILNHYSLYFKARFRFILEENGKCGVCSFLGNTYIIIWRTEIRKHVAERILRKYGKQPILVLAKKIYGPAMELFKEYGINFLEQNGHAWVNDNNAQTFYRNLKNRYDQRINASRIEGDFGSRIRAALKLKKELLNLKKAELAKYLRVSKSSIYYIFNQMKLLQQTEQLRKRNDRGNTIESYTIEEVFESLLKRGFNKLGISYLDIRKKINLIKLVLGKNAQKECVFFDELRGENISLEIKRHLDAGILIFKSPYNLTEFKELHEEFKKRFRRWYAMTDIDLLCV